MESSLQRVHGSALEASVCGPDAVFGGDQRFRVGGSHTEDSGEPAPEDGAGAAKGDGRPHADDVSGAERRGKGSGEGGERADAAVRSCAARKGETDCQGQLSLDEPGLPGQEKVGAGQEEDHGKAPEKLICSFCNMGYSFHNASLHGCQSLRFICSSVQGNK